MSAHIRGTGWLGEPDFVVYDVGMRSDERRGKPAKANAEDEERAQQLADLRSCFTENRRAVIPKTKEQERAKADLHQLVFSRDPPLDPSDRQKLEEAIAEVERVWPASATKTGGSLATLLEAARILLEDGD
jgi:hypothetical protein